MKRLAGSALLLLVMILEGYCHCVVWLARVTRPFRRAVRWARMKVLMWRSNHLCRQIAGKQKRLGRLLRRYDILDV